VIYKKINEIMKKVEFVTKDGMLGFGNNKFSVVTHDKVLSVVRQHFVDEGVLILPSQVEKGVSIPGKTAKGGDIIRMEALYDVTFLAAEDGSMLTLRVEAHAVDNGDKAPSKCVTYAVKSAILKVLSLQSGDDYANEMRLNTLTDKQTSIIAKLLQKSDTDAEAILDYYGVGKISELNQDNFSQVVERLQKKVK